MTKKQLEEKMAELEAQQAIMEERLRELSPTYDEIIEDVEIRHIAERINAGDMSALKAWNRRAGRRNAAA